MRDITNRQAEILGYIKSFIQKNNYSPSIREIANHFLFSAKAAHDHLSALEKKGYIKTQHSKARTITIKENQNGNSNN